MTFKNNTILGNQRLNLRLRLKKMRDRIWENIENIKKNDNNFLKILLRKKYDKLKW